MEVMLSTSSLRLWRSLSSRPRFIFHTPAKIHWHGNSLPPTPCLKYMKSWGSHSVNQQTVIKASCYSNFPIFQEALFPLVLFCRTFVELFRNSCLQLRLLMKLKLPPPFQLNSPLLKPCLSRDIHLCPIILFPIEMVSPVRLHTFI